MLLVQETCGEERRFDSDLPGHTVRLSSSGKDKPRLNALASARHEADMSLPSTTWLFWLTVAANIAQILALLVAIWTIVRVPPRKRRLGKLAAKPADIVVPVRIELRAQPQLLLPPVGASPESLAAPVTRAQESGPQPEKSRPRKSPRRKP